MEKDTVTVPVTALVTAPVTDSVMAPVTALVAALDMDTNPAMVALGMVDSAMVASAMADLDMVALDMVASDMVVLEDLVDLAIMVDLDTMVDTVDKITNLRSSAAFSLIHSKLYILYEPPKLSEIFSIKLIFNVF